ncbi:hem peroxidase [Dillenia turbinata]|uniref:peroxidase n=1 Tax=Dillenia turbinata TaxID=194707 RepID=A0AAN8Z8B3_9MAGN
MGDKRMIHLIAFAMILCLRSEIQAQLEVSFYKNKCGDADIERIIKEEVSNAFSNDSGIAPGLLRLHFHDCFAGVGCEGSILIDSTPTNAAEKDGPPNGITIRGTEVIDSAKARIEALCRGVVSCADILAYAARDAVELTRGFSWDVPAGRRDGRVSLASQTADIPAPTFNLDQVTQAFAKKGLTQEEMRLYNFNSSTAQDPTLDPFYAAQLKRQCPRDAQGNIDPNLVVQMNESPVVMDPSYYADVLTGRGLFTSDQALSTSSDTTAQAQAQLQVGYYWDSCGFAEFIIKDEGCDGSVLIDSTSSNTAEKDAPPNNPSLRGFEVIDNAKARLESICKGVVSCADIVAFAARDSIEITGGQGYDVPAGRRDGRVSLASEALANLPPPTLDVNQLAQSFASKGLTQEEMVTLSGAHTIGRSHCTSFSNRLYNFSSTNSQDPTLDASYATMLQQQCPQGSTNPNLVVPMNPSSPFTTDVGYYMDVLANRGLFTSDQTLLTNTATANQVNQNAGNPMLWRNKFASAMVKMGSIGVLTGSAGEIRANCRSISIL